MILIFKTICNNLKKDGISRGTGNLGFLNIPFILEKFFAISIIYAKNGRSI